MTRPGPSAYPGQPQAYPLPVRRAESVTIETRPTPGTGPWTPVGGVSPDLPPGSFTDRGTDTTPTTCYVFGWHQGNGPSVWQVRRALIIADERDFNFARLIDADLETVADLRNGPALFVINTRVGRREVRLTLVRG